jgi:hypothetical protein
MAHGPEGLRATIEAARVAFRDSAPGGAA